MMNLFDYAQENASEKQGQTKEGLRLQTLEVYNWGTFHKQIWSFTPQGATTLLTGDSGSGKSTLVDALLTLFVSPRKIAYNKAADATAKERSMNSYMRGYYGQKYAYEGKGKPEALRDETQYSVLLATLQDVELDKTVTLAVFFWFREQQTMPQHFYVVAQKPLSIVRDFSGFHGNVKQLRATLKENECEVFDDYPKYGVCYQKALGGLRPQAIDLFQQTISMKKVEALTDFVRSNMLEETNIAEEIDHLLQHYNSLNSAFEAVRCARKQTQQLRPICQNGTQHTMQKAALTEVDQARSALEDWFASQKKELYVVRVAQLKADFAAAAETLERKRSAYEKLEQNILRLNGEIYENGGGALESLRAELARKQEAKTRCCSDLAQYRQYAQQLSLREPDTRDAFLENRQKMKALYDVLPSEKENAQNELTQISIHLDGEKKKKIEIDDEISSLRGRTSNIPKMLISLRENLCKALSIAPEHLPFAGELLEVKESENAWE
ncbi:MAG: ATP-binding protein, partial [Ruthenibacterium sp.]